MLSMLNLAKGFIMAYQIRVNCSCGKILKIPEKYAGKKGICPHCKRKISIPSLEDLKNQPAETKEPMNVDERQCPTCGAYLNKGDKFCVTCHTNLSTGEWEADTYKEVSPFQGNLKMIGVFTSVGVIACIALTIVVYRWVTKPPMNLSNSVVTSQPVETTKPEESNRLQMILDMPENDLVSVETKNKAIIEFLENKDTLSIWKSYQKLQAKKYELQAQSETEKLSKENPIQYWNALNKIAAKYSETTYAHEGLATEQKNAQEQILSLLRKYSGDAQENFASKNYELLLEKNMENLQGMLSITYDNPEIQQELSLLLDSSKRALEEIRLQKQQAAVLTVAPSKELENIELDTLKKDYNDFISKYRELLTQCKFQEAFSKIQPIAQKAEEFKSKYPEDIDLPKVAETFQEVKMLNKVWDYTIENAAALKGKPAPLLFTRKGKPIVGLITKYDESKITVEKDGKSEVFELADLMPRSVGTLSLIGNEKNVELYQALVSYYYINNEDILCNETAEAGIKIGLLASSIEKQQKWAAGVLEERKRKLDSRTQKIAEEQKLLAQRQEENRIERMRQEASVLVRQIVEDYRANKDQIVLEYLYTLKTKIGDQPGGRDELIKINYTLKKEEGQSLAKIAENAYNRCPFCRNSGEMKCRLCKGEGIIEGEERQIGKDGEYTTIKGKKKYCEACKAKGVIDCPYCSEKRNNRRYIMIKDYYNNF